MVIAIDVYSEADRMPATEKKTNVPGEKKASEFFRFYGSTASKGKITRLDGLSVQEYLNKVKRKK